MSVLEPLARKFCQLCLSRDGRSRKKKVIHTGVTRESPQAKDMETLTCRVCDAPAETPDPDIKALLDAD